MPGYVIGYYPNQKESYIPYGFGYTNGDRSSPNPSIILYFPYSKIIASSMVFRTHGDVYPTEWTFSVSDNNITWTELIHKTEHMCPPEHRLPQYNKIFCDEIDLIFPFDYKKPLKFIKFTMIKNSFTTTATTWGNTLYTRGIELIGTYESYYRYKTCVTRLQKSYSSSIVFLFL